jgi:hypothetical protein
LGGSLSNATAKHQSFRSHVSTPGLTR